MTRTPSSTALRSGERFDMIIHVILALTPRRLARSLAPLPPLPPLLLFKPPRVLTRRGVPHLTAHIPPCCRAVCAVRTATTRRSSRGSAGRWSRGYATTSALTPLTSLRTSATRAAALVRWGPPLRRRDGGARRARWRVGVGRQGASFALAQGTGHGDVHPVPNSCHSQESYVLRSKTPRWPRDKATRRAGGRPSPPGARRLPQVAGFGTRPSAEHRAHAYAGANPVLV